MPASSRYSFASLAHTFAILVNTPMIPPTEKLEDLEVAMIDMPSRMRRDFPRVSHDSGSDYTSSNTSLRNSLEISPGSAQQGLELSTSWLDSAPTHQAQSLTFSAIPVSPTSSIDSSNYHEGELYAALSKA